MSKPLGVFLQLTAAVLIIIAGAAMVGAVDDGAHAFDAVIGTIHVWAPALFLLWLGGKPARRSR